MINNLWLLMRRSGASAAGSRKSPPEVSLESDSRWHYCAHYPWSLWGSVKGPQLGRRLDFPFLPVPLGGCDGACAPRAKASVCWQRVPEQALESQSQV